MPAEILYGVIGFLASLVVVMIGVIWNMQTGATRKIFEKLDELGATLHGVENGLRGELTELDRRVTRIEARCPNSECKA